MDAPNRRLLLIVDDESRSTRVLARMLREDGFDVEIAFDGAAAISRLTRAPIPDALVTDVRMPHVDGVTVAKYARSRRPDLPVVYVTGYPQLVHFDGDGLPAPTALHTKPVNYTRLFEQLRDLLGDERQDFGILQGEDPVLEEQFEHEQLDALMAMLDTACTDEEMSELVDKLRRYLERHFDSEEADRGLYAEILRVAPRFARKIQELRSQHPQLLEKLEDVTRALREAGVDSTRTPIEVLRRSIEKHEGEERSLLQVAFESDLGNGD